jgi:DNA-binding transcriptional regulator of glucitol operon
VAGHVLVLAAAVAMVFLGHWQLTVSERKGFSLQNFGYAFQWWAFSIFAVGFWIKIVRDAVIVRPPAGSAGSAGLAGSSVGSQSAEAAAVPEGPVAYRRYVMPNQPPDLDDPEIVRYNAYLAALAEQDKK